MTNRKISEETYRSPLDGSENVRLALSGRNYRTSILDIAKLAIAGSSGQIQVNSSGGPGALQDWTAIGAKLIGGDSAAIAIGDGGEDGVISRPDGFEYDLPQFYLRKTLDTTDKVRTPLGAAMWWETAGDDVRNILGLQLYLAAGFSGSGLTRALDVNNFADGGQYWGIGDTRGNHGATIQAQGGAGVGINGDNIGAYCIANGSLYRNVAVYGRSFTQGEHSELNVGICGTAGGTSGGTDTQIGGWFNIGNAVPIDNPVSAAGLFDNNGSGLPIIVGRNDEIETFSVSGGMPIVSATGYGIANANISYPTIRTRASGGTYAVPTLPLSTTLLGAVQFEGWGGSAFKTAARIVARTMEDWTGSTIGTELRFGVAAVGSSGSGDRMALKASGGLVVAGSTSGLNNYDPGPGGFLATGPIYSNNQIVAGSFFDGVEIVEPDSPAPNGFRIFAKDDGAGKTQLYVKFATGAAQLISAQP